MYWVTLERDFEHEWEGQEDQEDQQCLYHVSATRVRLENAKVRKTYAHFGNGKCGEDNDLGGVGILLCRDGAIQVFSEKYGCMASSTISNLTVLADTVACT